MFLYGDKVYTRTCLVAETRGHIKTFACRSTACAQTEVNTTAASREKAKQTQASVAVLHRWSFMEIR